MRLTTFLFSILLVFLCGTAVSAQTAEDPTSSRRGEREELPKSVKEMLSKMQVDQSKKEYKELIDRGEELVAISDELEKSVDSRGTLDEPDLEKLATAEKIVKKIRGELGGGDDTDEDSEMPKISGKADGIKYLKQQAGELVDELKKSSRFTVSVVAIQSSNTLLRLVRILRTGN